DVEATVEPGGGLRDKERAGKKAEGGGRTGLSVWAKLPPLEVLLLELGRPREGRTVVGRESKKKKKGLWERGVSGRERGRFSGALGSPVLFFAKGGVAGCV
ncbi:hypothetical protein H0E87_000489, partial [Populus deltoides]